MTYASDYNALVERLAAMSFEDLEKEFPTAYEGYWAWLVYEVMKKKMDRCSQALEHD
jgi:hypothetical protein